MDTVTNEQLSKRERREQEQQERIKREQRERQKELLRRIGLWSAAICGLGILVWGLAKLGSSGAGTINNTTLAEPVTGEDWIRGNKNGTVTLVEYSDFQCPACRAAEPVVAELVQKYGDTIRVVYRHYPLNALHAHAEEAARAAEAAGRQGKFWEMHDMLFENQARWAAENNPETLFVTYAQQLALDTNKFLSDFDATEIRQKITAQQAGGDRAKITATPTFFLNGKGVNLQNFGDLVDMVGAAVEKTIQK